MHLFPSFLATLTTSSYLYAEAKTDAYVTKGPSNTWGGSYIACSYLSKIFPEKVSFPSSSAYNLSNTFWSATAQLSPGCIFAPTNSDDVAVAVKTLVETNTPFAVKSGGHSSNPGWADINGGVLLTLSNLKSLVIQEGYVEVGPGNIWGDVYKFLDPLGLSAVGARVSGVGVGGYLLGGGLSYLSNERGWGCDNVKSFEIVIANGTVTTASLEKNPDLFHALKGSSNNLGVVTRFDLYTYPTTGVYAGSLYYLEEYIPALFNATVAYALSTPDVKSHIIPAFGQIPGETVGVFYVFYNEPVDTVPEALKPFLEIPTFMNTVRIKNVSAAAQDLQELNPSGMRHRYLTFSIKPNSTLFTEIFALFTSRNSAIEDSIPGWLGSIAFQPLVESLLSAGDNRGGNILGFENGRGPLIIVSFDFAWSNATDDATAIAAVEGLVEDLTNLAKKRGLWDEYIYLNYGDAKAKVIESYGAVSVEVLQEAKRKWDPKNVFGRLVKGGFKIPMGPYR
ncbi:hypothetical protein RUND412_002518 [Rhizina undulata]